MHRLSSGITPDYAENRAGPIASANLLGISNKYVDTTEAKQYHPQPLEVSTRDQEKGFRFHLTDVAAQRSVHLNARRQLPEPKHVKECSHSRLVPLLVHAIVDSHVRACLTCPPL
jgi:hypothetical protein